MCFPVLDTYPKEPQYINVSTDIHKGFVKRALFAIAQNENN